MPKPRRYDATTFRAALQDPAVETIADVCRRLGLVPRGGNYESIRRYADELGVAGLLPARAPRQFNPPITWREDPDRFRAVVSSARSLAEVHRAYGRTPTSAGNDVIRAAVADLELDTTHFLGRAANAGRSFPDRRLPPEQLSPRGTWKLGRRLVSSGQREHRCTSCRRERWEGQPIPLELDHIDGDRTNNALTNLRLLCPNCHAQTPTYRGRNIGRRPADRRP